MFRWISQWWISARNGSVSVNGSVDKSLIITGPVTIKHGLDEEGLRRAIAGGLRQALDHLQQSQVRHDGLADPKGNSRTVPLGGSTGGMADSSAGSSLPQLISGQADSITPLQAMIQNLAAASEIDTMDFPLVGSDISIISKRSNIGAISAVKETPPDSLRVGLPLADQFRLVLSGAYGAVPPHN